MFIEHTSRENPRDSGTQGCLALEAEKAIASRKIS
jgi:hypothetical protein